RSSCSHCDPGGCDSDRGIDLLDLRHRARLRLPASARRQAPHVSRDLSRSCVIVPALTSGPPGGFGRNERARRTASASKPTAATSTAAPDSNAPVRTVLGAYRNSTTWLPGGTCVAMTPPSISTISDDLPSTVTFQPSPTT